MHGGYDARAMAEPDSPVPVLMALIALAQAQLAESWAEVRDQNTYALALAALGIAVIGIVAAIQSPLGHDWWVPIPGLAVTSVVALVGTRRVRADFGPNPASFYEDHGTKETPAALAQSAFGPDGHTNQGCAVGPPSPAHRLAGGRRAVRDNSGLFDAAAGVE